MTEEEAAALETAYRRATFKLIFVLGFIVACCVGAAMARQLMGLPPALLSAVLIVALLLFSPEIFRFLRLRNQVQSMREEQKR